MKSADVIPIHKSKEKHIAPNYRPISLISNLAKILEKIIHKRITTFINKCDILSKNQYGFRKNKSTKDALTLISNVIYGNLDKSTPIAITFLDLAKAFDTVNHQILLDKLYIYGIRGNAHNLIKNYLGNRQQKVKLNNITSQLVSVDIGVPQGTMLRLLLFLLYINDLLLDIPEDSIVSYADDTAVVTSWIEVETKMNETLHKISTWLAYNKLSLNTDKTVYIEFGNQVDSTTKDLDIQGTKINRVENTKYLGMIFDSHMRWNKHIEYIYNKTKYLIFIFYKLSKLMTTDTLRMVYYALFHSIVSYGIIAWGRAYPNSKNILNRLQIRLLKIINKNKFSVDKNPMSIDKIFTYESLIYHYEDLQTAYINSSSTTRKKSLRILED